MYQIRFRLRLSQTTLAS